MLTTVKAPKRDRTSPVDEIMYTDYVDALCEEAIRNGLFPGCTFGAFYDAGSGYHWQYHRSYGTHTYDAGSPQVTNETFYDVASVTKTFPTSLLLLRLIDEGVICNETFDEPIQQYLPEFQGPWTKEVTVKHILSFAIKLDTNELGKGFGWERVESLVNLGPDRIQEIIMKSGLARPPGLFAYHNTTSYIARCLIEELYNMSYKHAAEKFILRPLGITGGFLSGRIAPELVPPTEMQDDQLVRGVVHDEFSRALQLMGGIPSGSAGLFLNGNDGMQILRNFCQVNVTKLFNKMVSRTPGRFGGNGLAGQMRTNQLSDPDHIYGLGWDILDPSYGQCACGPESTMLITGFTGCVIMLQPTLRRGFFLFSNATFPHRHGEINGKNALYDLRRNLFLGLQSCKCDD